MPKASPFRSFVEETAVQEPHGRGADSNHDRFSDAAAERPSPSLSRFFETQQSPWTSMMAILIRLLRAVFVTILCIVIFAALFEFLNAIPTYLFLPDHLEGGVAYRGGMMLLGALWWGAVFRAPGYLFYGTVPLLIVLAVTEWRSMKGWPSYLAIWFIAGLAATGLSLLNPLRVAAVLLAAAAASYLYWLLAGKSAGDRLQGWRRRERNGGFKFVNYAAYAVLAYLAFQLAGYADHGGKLLWATFVSEPEPGTPPFQVRFKRPLTASQKVAMMDFPDPASCLKTSETDGLPLDRLKEMDWDRIDNTDEANVCMFRLLGSYPNLSYATDWYEAQGFRVPDNFSSARPYLEQDGTQRVSASYSIRKNGPKFPTTGIVRRAFGSIPYGMSVDATWSKDGKQLQWVETGFSTL
ncbi:hypothetical protein N2599_24100 (plasmid) [Rhizobium sullae]|uniref:Uncharacterized protein n=1 Tax=Rhizobium sullae TaxID=50338 RepID=A0ABY5XV31_RHISU|nr:hypothetical protein [Rhizobium sullae]UWU18328.1 hypothetical protein N2599_24100 [Rhizobium sullae]